MTYLTPFSIDPKDRGFNGAVVVAQLAERSLPTLEIHGSNPKIEFNCAYLSIAIQKRRK